MTSIKDIATLAIVLCALSMTQNAEAKHRTQPPPSENSDKKGSLTIIQCPQSDTTQCPDITHLASQAVNIKIDSNQTAIAQAATPQSAKSQSANSSQANNKTQPVSPSPNPTPTQNQNPNNPARILTRSTLPNKTISLSLFYNYTNDCKPFDWVEPVVIQKPEHGSIGIESISTTIYNYPLPPDAGQTAIAIQTQRMTCNGKAIDAKKVSYTPNKDYSGDDMVLIDVFQSSGETTRYSYTIHVIAPAQ